MATKTKEKATTTKETQDTATETTSVSGVFKQASEMTINQAVGVLAQTATMAQKQGILTVNDAVLVARALEIVQYNEEA
tara:strand:- start:8796 stop:9032 length:237 start_codon:yes stop_codon:yes gene_type:complete